MSKDDLHERLVEMETRLTFVDDTVSALSDADSTLSRRLQALEQAVRDLRNEMSAVRTAVGDDPHDEPPPPHY